MDATLNGQAPIYTDEPRSKPTISALTAASGYIDGYMTKNHMIKIISRVPGKCIYSP